MESTDLSSPIASPGKARLHRGAVRRPSALALQARSFARWVFGMGMAVLSMCVLFGSLSLTQGSTPSCALMAAVESRALVTGGERTTTSFDGDSCRHDAPAPQRMVVLTAAPGPTTQIKN
jgi:hypothetical protein